VEHQAGSVVPHFREPEDVDWSGTQMTKAVWSGVLTAAAMVVLSAAPAFAQASDNAQIAVTVNVNARAKLTLGTATITFNDADPDVTGTFSSGPISVDVKSRAGSGSNVTLTVVADDDLTSGGDTIPISDLTWTVTGAGFSAGTSDSTTAQTLGSWTGSGNRSGTHTYSLPNSWAYNVGSYTATLTYTLTAP
jgi:hypothetical protein